MEPPLIAANSMQWQSMHDDATVQMNNVCVLCITTVPSAELSFSFNFTAWETREINYNVFCSSSTVQLACLCKRGEQRYLESMREKNCIRFTIIILYGPVEMGANKK